MKATKCSQQTFTGKLIDLRFPTINDIDIVDIAHALSMICRFNGCANKFYSVAEHCIHACRMAEPGEKLHALLHDATEAYLGDVTRPLKSLLPEYKRLEKVWENVIAKKFNIPNDKTKTIAHIDGVLQVTEFFRMLNTPITDLLKIPAAVSFDFVDKELKIYNWLPQQAKEEYLKCYDEFKNEIRKERRPILGQQTH